MTAFSKGLLNAESNRVASETVTTNAIRHAFYFLSKAEQKCLRKRRRGFSGGFDIESKTETQMMSPEDEEDEDDNAEDTPDGKDNGCLGWFGLKFRKMKGKLQLLPRSSKVWWKCSKLFMGKAASMSSIPPLKDSAGTWLYNPKEKGK